jgi:hypothetical protein
MEIKPGPGRAIDAQLLMEFEAKLMELLEELFNPEVPFAPTANLETCAYCDFKMICNR